MRKKTFEELEKEYGLSSQRNKKLMDALEEFIETHSGIYDLNDTAEFIYYERDGLLKLLKEWDEGDK